MCRFPQREGEAPEPERDPLATTPSERSENSRSVMDEEIGESPPAKHSLPEKSEGGGQCPAPGENAYRLSEGGEPEPDVGAAFGVPFDVARRS